MLGLRNKRVAQPRAKMMNKNEIFVTFAKMKFDETSGKLIDEQTISFIKDQLNAFDNFIDE
tara:strand:+ start:948 stop:1130 length:183 start_codon:yes stop_codon:yes gene_type:complete